MESTETPAAAGDLRFTGHALWSVYWRSDSCGPKGRRCRSPYGVLCAGTVLLDLGPHVAGRRCCGHYARRWSSHGRPNGKRFTDEGKTRGAIARDVLKLEDNVFYPVLDGHFVPTQVNPKEEVLQKWIDGGFVVTADTLEEVASKAETSFGIPAGTLIASIQAYNEGCSSGTDEFGKDPHFLTPINQAPFYVGPVETCIMLYTHGGLDADENAPRTQRRRRRDSRPYAAGMCTGGQFGTDTVSGSWQTNSIVFGRIAGANASKETAE